MKQVFIALASTAGILAGCSSAPYRTSYVAPNAMYGENSYGESYPAPYYAAPYGERYQTPDEVAPYTENCELTNKHHATC